jgi:hypothetical protein
MYRAKTKSKQGQAGMDIALLIILGLMVAFLFISAVTD